MLGGIQARLELGPYDMTIHTPSYFRTIMYRSVNLVIGWLILIYFPDFFIKRLLLYQFSTGFYRNMLHGTAHGALVYPGYGEEMGLMQLARIPQKLDSSSSLRYIS